MIGRGEPLHVGFWTINAIAFLGVLLPFGLIWLNIGNMGEQLANGLVWMLGIGLLLLVASMYLNRKAVSYAREDNLLLVVAIGLMVLIVANLVSAWLFPSSISDTYDNVLVAVTFAVYEETLFLGIASFCKVSGMPDIVILGISAAIFPLLHYWAYGFEWVITVPLIIGRLVFTGASLATDNTDAGYLLHILYNFFATI